MNVLVIGFATIETKAMMSPEETLKMIGDTLERIEDQEEQLAEYDRVLEFKSYDKDIGLHVNPAEVGQEVSYSFNVMDEDEKVELEMSITADLIADETVYEHLGMNDLYTILDSQNDSMIWAIIDFELTVEDSEVDVSHTIHADDFGIYFTRMPDNSIMGSSFR